MKYNLDFNFLENSTETLRAIAHPVRLAIIDMLYKSKRLSVTEIYEQLDIEQAVASHHLRILKDRDVVSVKREGKSSFYSLSNDEYHTIFQVLSKTITAL